MKSFFNKKINLILTIILIALIIYNLFNRPLIEGITKKSVSSSSFFLNTDDVPPDGQTIKVSGTTNPQNKAHNMGLIMTQVGATHNNALAFKTSDRASNIDKIKEKQTNRDNKLARLNAVND
jgi:hypothetical protein